MKNLFPQYADSTKIDFDNVWKQALFVFDTNVLLNLYRYQSTTRDELLKVLSQLQERIWIPHHVGLEFQRNRLSVIAEQNRRFIEVRRTIEKAKSGLFTELEKLQLQTRHSLIDPQPLTTGFERIVSDFLVELERLQETQQKPTSTDPLKEKIEVLFTSRVGAPPESQEEINQLYKQADERFKHKIPPGFQDADKDAGGYINGGIFYKCMYGDYLVWEQLIAHSKSAKINSLIFVTDDGDWWQSLDFDGKKTIGPHPELIEEIHLKASVDNFLMYSPESFLKFSKEFLKAKVSDETLEDVRQVAQESYQSSNPAVSVSQEVDINPSPDLNTGILRINVLRNTQIATGTGKFMPKMNGTPHVSATLVKMPDDLAKDMVKYSAGTGTNFDFNINIKSATFHNALPIGEYIFSYEAQSMFNIFGDTRKFS